MSKHRSRLEAILDILDEVRSGTGLSSDILRKTNMSYTLGKDLFPILIEQECLTTLQNSDQRGAGIVLTYLVTPKGKEMLEDMSKYSWSFGL